MLRALFLSILLSLPVAAQAQEGEPRMTVTRLTEILMALDPDLKGGPEIWEARIAETTLLVVADADNDRMRVMVPIGDAASLTPEELTRMMQANFDTALDGRYAIAQGLLWAAFIHPLGALEKDELISGIGQVINLADSFGTLYSGGLLSYGGGDSGALQRALIDDLLKRGEEI